MTQAPTEGMEEASASTPADIQAGATERQHTPAASRLEPFRPILIVGCQRSGTTGLAVMFDRHSRVATLPETQFFNKFVRLDRPKRLPLTHRALAERAVADYFMRHAHLTADEVLRFFEQGEPTYENLFRALLSAYSEKHAKPRPAEKSCAHLLYAPSILKSIPEAKMICTMRDGRDVVRSLQNSPVGRGQSVEAHCQHWIKYARRIQEFRRTLPADRFTVVKYEDLMVHPERELRRLCEFVGEQYEPGQIGAGAHSDVVPDIEKGWKGKAKDAPDPSRVGAWRRCADKELMARMNLYMGASLRTWGYPETDVPHVGWTKLLRWHARFLPYRRGLYWAARQVSRVGRGWAGRSSMD